MAICAEYLDFIESLSKGMRSKCLISPRFLFAVNGCAGFFFEKCWFEMVLDQSPMVKSRIQRDFHHESDAFFIFLYNAFLR